MATKKPDTAGDARPDATQGQDPRGKRPVGRPRMPRPLALSSILHTPVTDDLHVAVALLAEERGVSVSRLVREMLTRSIRADLTRREEAADQAKIAASQKKLRGY